MKATNIFPRIKRHLLSRKSIKRWYTWRPIIVLLLTFFFPVGLYLMWKFASWSKRKKWIITILLGGFWVLAFWGGYNQPPSISYDNVKDAKVSTDDVKFEVIGDVSSMKNVSLRINNNPVKISQVSEFSYIMPLQEGDNIATLEATNDNGTVVETITIHRTTKAEFTARAEAKRFEEELKVQQEEQKMSEAKAIADKEAAQKSKEDESKKKSLSNNAKADDKKSMFSWLKPNWSFRWLFGNSPEQQAKKEQEKKEKEQQLRAQEEAKLKTEAEKKAQEKARQEQEAQRKAAQAYTISDDEILFTLIDATKDNVKKVLKSPSTAEFPGTWLDPGEGWSSTRVDPSTVRLYSYVDSQNSFGAMLRSSFSMTWCKQNNTYSVIQFVFDGSTYINKPCA